MSQTRNCVPVPGRYLIHGHCGQHLQPDCRERGLYPLDSFAQQLVGLSTTQPVDEKRRWRLSFISFYPVIHQWLRTRTIRWHSTLPTYHVAYVSPVPGMWSHRDTLSVRLVQRSKRAIDGGARRQNVNGRVFCRWVLR